MNQFTDNRDISLDFKSHGQSSCKNTSTLEGIKKSTTGFLEYLSNYDTINTNRLHVGIAGCILNKKVNLYPNSYWKVEEVYKHSIEGKYPKARFIYQREGPVQFRD